MIMMVDLEGETVQQKKKRVYQNRSDNDRHHHLYGLEDDLHDDVGRKLSIQRKVQISCSEED